MVQILLLRVLLQVFLEALAQLNDLGTNAEESYCSKLMWRNLLPIVPEFKDKALEEELR